VAPAKPDRQVTVRPLRPASLGRRPRTAAVPVEDGTSPRRAAALPAHGGAPRDGPHVRVASLLLVNKRRRLVLTGDTGFFLSGLPDST